MNLEGEPKESGKGVTGPDVLAAVNRIYLNVGQDWIVITSDKLENVLSSHLKRCEKRLAWLNPTLLLIAILALILTGNPTSWPGNGHIWETLLWVVAVLSLGWAMHGVRQAVQSESLDDVLAQLKRDSVSHNEVNTLLHGVFVTPGGRYPPEREDNNTVNL